MLAANAIRFFRAGEHSGAISYLAVRELQCDTTRHDDAALQLEREDTRPMDLGVESFGEPATAGGYTDEVYRKVYCGRCLRGLPDARVATALTSTFVRPQGFEP